MAYVALADIQRRSLRPAFAFSVAPSAWNPEAAVAAAGEIGRILRHLSKIHLRAALYRLRFAGQAAHGRLVEITAWLERLGAVERLGDGSFALLDISPAAATADASAGLEARIAFLCGGREDSKVEIGAFSFWTDELLGEELPVPTLQ